LIMPRMADFETLDGSRYRYRKVPKSGVN
jgi:hypothetical protein